MTDKRRTAPEIIAFHFCSDIRDISDGRYQPTRYTAPAIYTVGEDYYCCPSGSQKLPKGFAWEKLATYYGRDIYCATLSKVEG